MSIRCMRSIASFYIVFILIFTMFTPVTAADDDLAGHWAEKIILQWAERDLIYADENGSFRPADAVTRAEFMTLVNRIMDYSAVSGHIVHYTDVSPERWYYDDVAKALAAGYMTGLSDSIMAPEATMTREEAIAVVARIAGLHTGQLNLDVLFSIEDRDDISHWATNYVAAALENNLIVADEHRIFPKNRLTRAEAVVLLDNMHTFIKSQTPEDGYTGVPKDGFAGGDGTLEHPYEIANETQLLNLAAQTAEQGNTFADKHYTLMAHINLDGLQWTPIAPDGFFGTFDGNGYIISNINITDDPEAFNAGLFASLKGGTVKNLGIHNVHIEGVGQFGAVAGSSENGTLDACFADGLVTMRSTSGYVGGLLGSSKSKNGQTALIRDCYLLPDEESSLYIAASFNTPGGVGGIVGFNSGVIETCYSSGMFRFLAIHAGIIAGVVEEGAVITDCYINEESPYIEDAVGHDSAEKEWFIQGYPTYKMKSASVYPGFDENKWRFVADAYPTLAVMKQP